jgi:hypothetical protein
MIFDTGRFLVALALLLVPVFVGLTIFISVPAAAGMLLARPVRDEIHSMAQNMSGHVSSTTWHGRWAHAIRKTWRNRPAWADMVIIAGVLWYAWTLASAQLALKGLATAMLLSFVAGFGMYLIPTRSERERLVS